MNEIVELMKTIDDFVSIREWEQFHTPANLAKSISIEAGELLECFQWNENADTDAVKEELADVMIYCLRLASVMSLDPNEIIRKKICVNNIKYPMDLNKGMIVKRNKM